MPSEARAQTQLLQFKNYLKDEKRCAGIAGMNVAAQLQIGICDLLCHILWAPIAGALPNALESAERSFLESWTSVLGLTFLSMRTRFLNSRPVCVSMDFLHSSKL